MKDQLLFIAFIARQRVICNNRASVIIAGYKIFFGFNAYRVGVLNAKGLVSIGRFYYLEVASLWIMLVGLNITPCKNKDCTVDEKREISHRKYFRLIAENRKTKYSWNYFNIGLINYIYSVCKIPFYFNLI